MQKVITAAFLKLPVKNVYVAVTTVKSVKVAQITKRGEKSQTLLLAKINDTKCEVLYGFGCKIAISKCLLLLCQKTLWSEREGNQESL